MVVLRPAASLTLEEMTQALVGRLVRFKLTRRLFIVDALPRDATTEVNNASLRSTFRDGFCT
ncbi:hypothetical protein SAMN07250955_101460 [Arboricoccus pini]|uniref:AMP-binding enzyme C-terminal domain-containing protein n=1 Tax=Arboricoccus pini TaxID=1963835 RepID=A0A212Q757_9PROT|nr:hypothetical protein SAMN07250955_101460 [Arboricoccus pini]